MILAVNRFFVLVFCLVTTVLYGTQTVLAEKPGLTVGIKQIMLSDRYGVADDSFFCDPSNAMQFRQLMESKDQIEFIDFSPDNAQIEKNKTYWLKFRIDIKDKEHALFLSFANPYYLLELYTPIDSTHYVFQQTGLAFAHHKWPVKSTTPTFVIPGYHNNERFFYLKVQSSFDSGLGLFLKPAYQYFNDNAERFIIYGAFFGIILVVALYSLIFYVKLRENAYLYYSLYVISLGIFAFVDHLFIVRLLTYIKLPWHYTLYTVPFICMTLFLMVYTAEFCSLRVYLPRTSIFIRVLILVRIIIFLIGYYFDIPSLHNPIIDNLILLPSYIAVIIRWRQGFSPAKYLFFGFTILFLGLLRHSSRNLIDPGSWVYNVVTMYNTGVFEILFFSFALADRYRLLKSENDVSREQTIRYLSENSQLQQDLIDKLRENEALKDKVNQELEQRVDERTFELKQANELIQQMNELLQADNIQLETNLKTISRKRVMDNKVSFEEFKEIYPNDESCYRYLEQLKWSNGFECKKCGYTRFSNGNMPFSRRCSRCSTIESITLGTIFERIKIPVNKSFYMLFLLCSGTKYTVDELSNMLDLRRQTCWTLRSKMLEHIERQNKGRKKSDNWTHFILLASLTEQSEHS